MCDVCGVDTLFNIAAALPGLTHKTFKKFIQGEKKILVHSHKAANKI